MTTPDEQLSPFTSAVSDIELVQRIKRGDAWAQAALYQRYARKIGAVLMRLLANQADAEDALQDTFLKAFEDIFKLQKAGSVGSWLTSIAVHQAHRRFRQRRFLRLFRLDRTEPDSSLESMASSSAGPETRAELALLNRILASLSGKQRIAWMLRYVEGYRLGGVAELCGCSLATAKRHIAAADRRIRRHVGLESL